MKGLICLFFSFSVLACLATANAQPDCQGEYQACTAECGGKAACITQCSEAFRLCSGFEPGFPHQNLQDWLAAGYKVWAGELEDEKKPEATPEGVVFSEHCSGTCSLLFGTTPTTQCWEYVEQTHQSEGITGNCGEGPTGQVCGEGTGEGRWLNGTHLSWTCSGVSCSLSGGIRCGVHANGSPRIYDLGTVTCRSADGKPPGVFGKPNFAECDGGPGGGNTACYCDVSGVVYCAGHS